MKLLRPFILLVAILSLAQSLQAVTNRPPNLIIILTDDQGYGDAEISTQVP